jgi:nicotinate-nucleotide adenylyltransferase
MEKVGILGGTFDPVHIGHLLVAQVAREACGLDRVILMPCHTPPHKKAGPVASTVDRLAMVRLAVDGDSFLSADAQEVERGGISFAVDTMRDFHQLHPGMEPHFIIGMDSLLELHLWHRVQELLPLCSFIVVERPGVDRLVKPTDLPLPPPWPERLLAGVIRGRLCEVSSSEIRRRVAENRTIRYLVPSPVERFILEHGLYRERNTDTCNRPAPATGVLKKRGTCH